MLLVIFNVAIIVIIVIFCNYLFWIFFPAVVVVDRTTTATSPFIPMKTLILKEALVPDRGWQRTPWRLENRLGRLSPGRSPWDRELGGDFSFSSASDDAGPCMGIEINIWEQAKECYFHIILLLSLNTDWWAAVARTGGMMPLITE